MNGFGHTTTPDERQRNFTPMLIAHVVRAATELRFLLINGRQILQGSLPHSPDLPLFLSFLAGVVTAFHNHNNARRPCHVIVKHPALAV